MIGMKNLIILGHVSALAISSASALAQETSVISPQQESGSTGGDGYGDIVVTANKREQNLSDVGLSVTAFSAESLATQRVATGQDLATVTPGLAYTPSPTNTPVFTLRGVGFYEGSLAAYPDVSLYIDQAPLPLPVMASKTMFDLERVEVLKGPQGTLFGNNATGGAINFVAAKPTKELSAGVEIGYGRFNTLDVAAFVSGPLASNLWARIALKAENGDEWQKSLSRNDKLGRKDNIAGRFLLDWEPTDSFSLSLNLNAWRDQDDPQATQIFRRQLKNPVGSVGFGGIVPADTPVSRTPVAPSGAPRIADWSPEYKPFTDNKFWQATVRADYEFADGVTLTSLSSYSDLKFHNSTDEDGSALVIYSYPNNQGRIKSFTQEARIANDATGSFRWVLGANYERTDADQISDQPSYDSSSAYVNGFGLIVADALQEMRNYAVFANAEFDISDKIRLKGGVRRSKAKRSTSNAGYTIPGVGPIAGLPYTTTEFFNLVYNAIYEGLVPPIIEGDSFSLDTRTRPDESPVNPDTYRKTGRYFGRLSENSTSWSIGMDFKPADGALFYGNISKGYKSGSFPFVAAAIFEGYSPVTQESLLSYEIGAKLEIADRRLTVNAAAFYYDYKDKQLRTKLIDPIFGALDKLQNVPKSQVKGAEIEILARPLEGLSVSGSATYLDATVKEYIGAVGEVLLPSGLRAPILASFAGERLPFAPKLSYALRFDYEFKASNTLAMFIGAGVNGQSRTYSTLVATPQAKSDFAIKGYKLFNATAGLKSYDDSWRIAIWGKNIFNKSYLTNRFESYDTFVQTTGRPAEYGMTLSLSY